MEKYIKYPQYFGLYRLRYHVIIYNYYPGIDINTKLDNLQGLQDVKAQ